MNERIRELAEQARVQDRGYFIYQYGTPISHQSVEKAIDLEKFAELIVRECISAVEQGLIENPPEGDKSFCQGSVNGCELAVSDIKKHFGVE